jgi:hypothetical protein
MVRGKSPQPNQHMALVIISIPLMVLAAAAAAIPLLVTSHRDHKERLESGEQRDHALALIEARHSAQSVVNVEQADSISEDTELPVAA